MGIGEKQGARYLDADEAVAGQRLDNFLRKNLKGVPKSRIYRTIRSGEVRVNSCRCQASHKLSAGDHIRIPPLRRPSEKPPPAGFAKPLPVIYEDSAIVVYDKPAGLAVHGGSGIAAGLIERTRAAAGPCGREYQLAHRLDRDTSGIVVVAKRRSALRALHALFREGRIAKKYAAIVKGTWEEGHRTLAEPLSKWNIRKGERLVGVDDRGKNAVTHTRCKTQWDEAAELEVSLVTGRTHQIRVHLANAGLPIVGDRKYGDFAYNRTVKAWGVPRLMLHAREARFVHPSSGERLRLVSPLPEEFALYRRRMEAKS